MTPAATTTVRGARPHARQSDQLILSDRNTGAILRLELLAKLVQNTVGGVLPDDPSPLNQTEWLTFAEMLRDIAAEMEHVERMRHDYLLRMHPAER